ncbi:MAG: hypothetical protein CL908_13965 [Deltaproteobacteria bacterium]|nr:hypothetical protein [Deltaproteobacteria bacterium]
MLRRARRVVIVPGAVPHAQKRSGLRQLRRQRIVGRVLRMMRMEASLCTLDQLAHSDDRAVDIERDASRPDPRPGRVGDVSHQLLKPIGDVPPAEFEALRILD